MSEESLNFLETQMQGTVYRERGREREGERESKYESYGGRERKRVKEMLPFLKNINQCV